ncbi:MAG TPA: HAD-IC family P-type ATPase [Candidatus Babeliales bacterium]|nr:HAD-IC family P-type ATPase [Candidatus Babeliales bacterium]
MESYKATIETITQTVATDIEKGLSEKEVTQRQRRHGYNILQGVKQRTIFSLFVSQFQNPLVYILFFAALIIFIFGEDKLDAFIISGVLFFNAILGTIQEARTKNIIENLKRYIKTESVVMRDGQKTVVDDKDLVVGDIIFLQEGQRIPADARVISSNNLRMDEAILTGEAHPTEKQSNPLLHDAPLSDRSNMLFKGTYVLAGAGKAVVTAIGPQTEIGKIQIITEEIDTDIPLRAELERLSHWILIFILITCLFLFGVGIFTGKPIKELLVMLTALFICVVPEGLPVVLTLVLVAGALQMAKHFVLVRNMQAVEALGRTNVIVIDKTGTLTRNEMIVSRVWTADNIWEITGSGYHCEGTICKNGTLIKNFNNENSLTQMAIAATLLNNAEVIHLPKLDIFDIKGDPTEAALSIFAQKIDAIINLSTTQYTKKYEIPFNSVTRYHAGFYNKDNSCIAFIIGSPEAVLKRTSHEQEKTTNILNSLLADGLRVVAIGIKLLPLHACSDLKNLEEYQALLNSDIELLGFAGIEDSIRPEVAKVIQEARNAGLSIVMATGDHQITALHVAKRVGIFRKDDDYVDGSEINQLTDEQLLARINHITVFSRVSAQHKMRIIDLLQKSGKIVAMTGDGINDAPSLVKADLGIAMGSVGTEVAKQAADLVLLNDSFATIVDAIEQGRHIFYTLKRIVLYFFSTNMGEILIVLFAFLTTLFTGIDLPLPITAVQILWLNLVTDGFLDVGLAMEPQEPGLLSSSWLEKKQQLIDVSLLLKMLFMAIPMGIGSLALFFMYYKIDLAHARTMTVITMAMYQWFNAWNCRSTTRSLFSIGLFSNKGLIIIMALVLALQSAIVYVPFMRYIFKTVPLSAHDWIVIIAVSAPIVIMEEIRKIIARRWYSQIDS